MSNKKKVWSAIATAIVAIAGYYFGEEKIAVFLNTVSGFFG